MRGDRLDAGAVGERRRGTRSARSPWTGGRSRPRSGAATLATTSAPHGSPIVAPASVNCVVGIAGRLAGAGLDDHLVAGARHAAHDVRGRAPRGARPRPSPWGLRLSRGRNRIRDGAVGREVVTSAAATSAPAAKPASRARRRRDDAPAARRGAGAGLLRGRLAAAAGSGAAVGAASAVAAAAARRACARGTGASGSGLRASAITRLRRDPHRRLAAGARVPDLAARRGQRAQVGHRVARAAAAHLAGSRPAARKRLHRPRGRLGVGRAARASAGSRRRAFWRRSDEAHRALDRLRALRPAATSALHGGAGVVDPGRAAAAGEVEAAVLVGLAGDPAARARAGRASRRPAAAARGRRTRSC